MTEFQVNVPSPLDAAVAERISRGGYVDVGEYLRDLLRRDLIGRGEGVSEANVLQVRALWLEGVNSDVLDDEPEDVLEQIIAEIPAIDGAA